jgi:hypothetical protein
MRHEPRLMRFRSAILAIAGMIMVSAAGAFVSYLSIEAGVAATSLGGVTARAPADDDWLGPGDTVDRFVATPLIRDVADWAGLEDSFEIAGSAGPGSATFLDPIVAAEIACVLLTILTVVVAAQRLAEFGPRRDGGVGTGDD